MVIMRFQTLNDDILRKGIIKRSIFMHDKSLTQLKVKFVSNNNLRWKSLKRIKIYQATH
jgi:hypothetical protein